MVFVYVLVFVNTLMFSGQIFPIISTAQNIPGLCAKDKRKCTRGYYTVIFFLFFSIFLSGTLALLILLALFNAFFEDSWSFVMKINEGSSLLMFFFFLVADLRCLAICKCGSEAAKRCELDSDPKCAVSIERQSKKREETFKSEAKLLEKYVMGVDLPGFIGLLVIVGVSLLFYPAEGAVKQTFSLSYWQGFTTGAIALHIAFSQVALACLSATDAVEDTE